MASSAAGPNRPSRCRAPPTRPGPRPAAYGPTRPPAHPQPAPRQPMTLGMERARQGSSGPAAAAGQPSVARPMQIQPWPGRGGRAPRCRGPHDPGLLLVFASGRYDWAALAAEISDVAAGIPVVGCSSAGEIDGGGPGDAIGRRARARRRGPHLLGQRRRRRPTTPRRGRARGRLRRRRRRPRAPGPAAAQRRAGRRQPTIVRGAYSRGRRRRPARRRRRWPRRQPAATALAALRRGAADRRRGRRRDRLRRADRRRRAPRLARRWATRCSSPVPGPGRVLELDGRPAADGLPRAARRPARPPRPSLAHPLGHAAARRRGATSRFVGDDDAPRRLAATAPGRRAWCG